MAGKQEGEPTLARFDDSLVLKSVEEINKAREVVYKIRKTKKLTDRQADILRAISVALCWVLNNPNGSTLQRFLDGEEIR